jgi:hypothetical protein
MPLQLVTGFESNLFLVTYSIPVALANQSRQATARLGLGSVKAPKWNVAAHQYEMVSPHFFQFGLLS